MQSQDKAGQIEVEEETGTLALKRNSRKLRESMED